VDLEIRAPWAGDAERAARMHYVAWTEAYGALLPGEFWSAAREQRLVESWVARAEAPEAGSTTLIALREGDVVGFATAGAARVNPTAIVTVRELELWSLYLLASEYGSGLADQLLDGVLPGSAPAELWVFEANGRARRFYERRGFVPDGGRHVFGAEFGGQAEIRMVR
jgi:GNAT superfamily N-acetyltransferase